MSDWSVEFYSDGDGDSAVLDWYESLDWEKIYFAAWIPEENSKNTQKGTGQSQKVSGGFSRSGC